MLLALLYHRKYMGQFVTEDEIEYKFNKVDEKLYDTINQKWQEIPKVTQIIKTHTHTHTKKKNTSNHKKKLVFVSLFCLGACFCLFVC